MNRNREYEKPARVIATGKIDLDSIPAHVRRNVARAAFNSIAAAYQDPAIRADFERWQAERQKGEQHG